MNIFVKRGNELLIIPDILNNTEYPSFQENFRSLIESVSKEEAALAKLIQIEADKINSFTIENLDFSSTQSPKDLLGFIQSTKRINDLITMKEWLLNQKIQNIILLKKKMRSDTNIGDCWDDEEEE